MPQSESPKPRSSYLITVAMARRSSRKWRHTGLCQSKPRWLSQQEARSRGGPVPCVA